MRLVLVAERKSLAATLPNIHAQCEFAAFFRAATLVKTSGQDCSWVT